MTVTKKQIEDALSEVYDPEIYIDVISLGLIYNINIKKENVDIDMTFTFPGCPYGPSLTQEVKEAVEAIKETKKVTVNVTFEPPWSPEKMDKDIRSAMNL